MVIFSRHSLMLISVVLLASGCATMIRGTEERLEVTSEPTGAAVELSDGRAAVTPAQFETARKKTLIVKVSKEGYFTEAITVTPKPAVSGVLLSAVFISWAFDYRNGAAYSLKPNPVHAVLRAIPSLSDSTALDTIEERTTAEQLRDLKRLKDEGLITEEQYQKERKKIIDNL
jgi:hypothetical protein